MAFLRWGFVFGPDDPDDLYACPADALWVDGGGVDRVEVQIGRKGRYRGVISASAGLLRQLNAADAEPLRFGERFTSYAADRALPFASDSRE